jgi:hypothetical protein
MKSLFLSASLIIALIGCKQADNTVTPVDPIPGEYQATATATYTIDGKTTTQTATGTLSVYAGNSPGSYYFVERYPSYEQGYLTTFSNDSFTLSTIADVVRYNNIEWYGYQNGSGKTSTGKLTFSKATDANSGLMRTGTLDTQVNKPVQKRVSIVATK